ncbi:phage repressor protein CI [Enterobacter hormaechei subsp. steigerwaltii]|uniref:phage repressor protein CI n=1 Tax=Enterobacter hormaechei TaxID=158836 RepID=UPI001C63BC49|nr:phage repressor protein CI [Enterobacter hormaechei]HDS5872108.1 phage repressor protein CI [Enterobacter hormaechei subsp. steigerwaltii]ELC6552982.1 phage repressor protein CI [Enterobacter hormaechei]ELD7983164.1 phage repressor protein CI [Enterobacter hormaechei]MBW7741501.1 helix-turn-helix domain-containing protein [Enterobacter hormaechei]MCM7616365.1 helix-turn-helix domain-containing protein [Enterobacter hormaechei]
MSNTKETPKAISKYNFPSQSGGKEAITRILQAYGFSTRQALCDHLGVSQSTMANRWMRDTFPHDWLIACHLDTGASMLWLTTGQGASTTKADRGNKLPLQLKEISNGVFSSTEEVHYDSRLLPQNTTAPFIVKFDNSFYLVDEFRGEINDGIWLIELDGFMSIRQVYRLPGGRLRVENGPASFECKPSDIEANGRVISKITFTE